MPHLMVVGGHISDAENMGGAAMLKHKPSPQNFLMGLSRSVGVVLTSAYRASHRRADRGLTEGALAELRQGQNSLATL